MMPRRIDLVFVLLLAIAAGVRLHLAATQPYIHDEENNTIPLARLISFDRDAPNLPLRGENHPALPAYVAKASAALFGTSPFGYRLLHVVAGLLTLVLAYAWTRSAYGDVAARWVTALLAFNEYSLNVSSRVTAHAPHQLLIAAAVFSFARFLHQQRPKWLYAAGAFTALAFYCKEHSALLVPVFFATLLPKPHRDWLRRPAPYVACLVFAAVIAPDVIWNASADPATTVTYGDQRALQAGYASHLRRVGGIGLSPYPSMFYARDAVQAASRIVTGSGLYDETPEYTSMNVVLGVVLVGGVIATTLRGSPGDWLRPFLLVLFWGIFGFFSLIKKGDPPGRLSPVSWMWVEVTIFAAITMTAARLADQRRPVRIGLGIITAAALLFATVSLAAAF